MPILNLRMSADGPLVDLAIGVSFPRERALRLANQAVPNPVQLRALIDTGASCTCIEAGALAPLGLSPTGVIPITTPSSGLSPAICSQYDVSITIVHPTVGMGFPAIPVVECQSLSSSFQALLGRDLLQHCLFVYDGHAQQFSLAF